MITLSLLTILEIWALYLMAAFVMGPMLILAISLASAELTLRTTAKV